MPLGAYGRGPGGVGGGGDGRTTRGGIRTQTPDIGKMSKNMQKRVFFDMRQSCPKRTHSYPGRSHL